MGKCLSRSTEPPIENRCRQPEKPETVVAQTRIRGDRTPIPNIVTEEKRQQANQKICHDIVLYSPPKSKSARNERVDKSSSKARPNVSPLNLSSVISDDSDVSDVYESITVVLASTEQSRYTENKRDPPKLVDTEDLNAKRIEWNNRYLLSAVVPRKTVENNAYSKYMGSSYSHENPTSRNTQETSQRLDTELKDNSSGGQHNRAISVATTTSNKNLNVNYEPTKDGVESTTQKKQVQKDEGPSIIYNQTALINGTQIETNNSMDAKHSVYSKEARIIEDVLSIKSTQKNTLVDTERSLSSQSINGMTANDDKRPPIGFNVKEEKDFSFEHKPSFLRTIENANDAITRLRSTEFRSTSTKRGSTRGEGTEPAVGTKETHGNNNKSFLRNVKKDELLLDVRDDDQIAHRPPIHTASQILNPEPAVEASPLNHRKSGHVDANLNIRTTQSTTSNYSTVRNASDAIARLRSVSRGRSRYWEPSICSDLSETFSWNEDTKDAAILNYLPNRDDEDKENATYKHSLGKNQSPDHISAYTMSTLSFTFTK